MMRLLRSMDAVMPPYHWRWWASVTLVQALSWAFVVKIMGRMLDGLLAGLFHFEFLGMGRAFFLVILFVNLSFIAQLMGALADDIEAAGRRAREERA